MALRERMDARAYLVIARYELGRQLVPGAEGTTLIEQAGAAAEELGMPGWARRAQAALAGVDAPTAAEHSAGTGRPTSATRSGAGNPCEWR